MEFGNSDTLGMRLQLLWLALGRDETFSRELGHSDDKRHATTCLSEDVRDVGDLGRHG